MPLPLNVSSFGSPRSVIEAANPGLLEKGIIRRATNAVLDGLGRMRARGGTRSAVTLLDENGDPVTTVCAVAPFRDGALAAGWSSTTQKVYLYAIDAAVTTATRIVPGSGLDYLWAGCTTAPVVWIAEGLGCAYIAHGEAADSDTLAFASRVWEPDADTMWFLNADLDGADSAEGTYFSGFVSYHSHLVGWGFDQGTTPETGYRPEYLRIGSPNFGEDLKTGGFAENGDAAFSVGNRIRSDRERILAACVAGDVCYVASPYALHALTGYGRDTWEITTLDSSLGAVSSRAMCDVGGTLYYWSPRGPARVRGLAAPDPLWDALPDTVATVANPQRIVAAYDVTNDQVLFVYGRPESDGETRAVAAFDVRRDVWVGPDSLLGTEVFCMGTVTPVLAASIASPGPLGPPTDPSTAFNSGVSITASVVPGDTQAGTETVWQVFRFGSGLYVSGAILSSTVTSFTFSNLPPNESLYWNAYHRRNGVPSATAGNVFFSTGAAVE